MADTKISAMPAATICSVADELPIVQAGVNNKITRPVLLTCETGETLYLNKGVSGKVGMRNAGGTVLIEIDGTDNLGIVNSAGTISIDYTPAVAGDWNGAAPTTIEEALDRCAALLKVLNGGVGP